jgi:hypothetical protein
MRIIIRGVLIIVTILVIATVVLLFISNTYINKENSAVISASLAVIAAIVSAWGAIRVVERSEDAEKPYLYPSFDLEGRYNLIQLVLRNYGGSPAYNINLDFNEHVLDIEGNPVNFSVSSEASDIPVLLPGERISVIVGGSGDIISKYSNLNFSGQVSFENRSKKKYKYKFYISLEQYRKTILYGNEELRTNYELQKLPKLMKEISNELQEIKNYLKGKN